MEFLCRFYPTRLALNIATGQNKPVARDIEKEGYIIVETNYRVYAYSNSNLQVALLGLFCEMLYRFPNLVVSILTRESVRQALRSGITAAQIVGSVVQNYFFALNEHISTTGINDDYSVSFNFITVIYSSMPTVK